MELSLTQAGNYAALVGFVLKLLNINIGTDEITQAVTALMVLGGLAASWYGRYRVGDLKLSGLRK